MTLPTQIPPIAISDAPCALAVIDKLRRWNP